MKIFKLNFLCLLIILLVANKAMALNYYNFKLNNGLDVYLIKTNVPIVTYTTWYNVGALDEPSGKDGLAHFLEHMMFEGTNRYKGDYLTKLMQKAGGSFNAFTNYDHTVYYETFPKYFLANVMKTEADRMHFLKITEAGVDKERKIIKEERGLRVDNDPFGSFIEQANRYVFPNTSYGKSLIGQFSNLDDIKVDDVKGFYQNWYSPNNAKIFVIGNIDPKTFKRLVQRYYSFIPKNYDLPEHYHLNETGYKFSTVSHIKDERVTENIYLRSYIVPSWGSEKDINKVLSMIVLNNVISSQSSNFYKVIVKEKKLATNIYVNYDPSARLNTSFSIIAIPSKNVSFNVLSREIDKQVNLIAKKGLAVEQISLALRELRDNYIYMEDDPSNYVMFFAELVMNNIDIDNINNFVKEDLEIADLNRINSNIKSLLKGKYVTTTLSAK